MVNILFIYSNKINFAAHLGEIGKALDTHSTNYENTLLIGDFNVEPNETYIIAFCNQHKLKALNKESARFKNIDKSSSIYLFLTNSSKCFEDYLTVETGLSDFNKLVVAIMKTKHQRFPVKIVKYRDYKNVDTKGFNNRLQFTLKSATSFEKLKEIFMDLLNKFASLK